MRTGAIFARGSCRALKWMALLGVVFALGSVPVAADIVNAELDVTVAEAKEGGRANVTVTLTGEVTAGGAAQTVTVTLAGTTSGITARAGSTVAEPGDWVLANTTSNESGASVTTELRFGANRSTSQSSPIRQSATFVLQAEQTDGDAEHEDISLTATATSTDTLTALGGGALSETEQVTIMDTYPHEQRYELKPVPSVPRGMTPTAEEGAEITATLEAVPPHYQGSAELTLQLGDVGGLGYSIASIVAADGASSDGTFAGTNTVTIGSGDSTRGANTVTRALITFSTTKTNDGNRVDDTLMLSAHSGVPGNAEERHSLSIKVLDDDVLPPIEVEPKRATATEGGDKVTLELTVDRNPEDTVRSGSGEFNPYTSEELVINVRPGGTASSSDYEMVPTSMMVEVPAHNGRAPWTQDVAVEVTAVLDEVLDDGETLSLDFIVEGTISANGVRPADAPTYDDRAMLTIEDMTPKHVEVVDGAMAIIEEAIATARGDDGTLNVGEFPRIAKSALFDSPDSHTVRVQADSSNSAVISAEWDDGPEVWLRTLKPGTATITITGTAVPVASGAVGNYSDGNVSVDVAEIMFDVTVELAAPGMPRNLEAAEGDERVALSWDHPNTGGAHSGYESRVDAGEWMTHPANATGYVYSDLTNGEDYLFEVRAVNDAGKSDAASVKATPEAAPLGPQVTVKEVKAATSVNESGGLDVTVVATVPAGTKGADGKYSKIPLRQVAVRFAMDHDSITPGEDDAEQGELRVLDNNGGRWTDIQQAEKESTANYTFRVAVGQDLDAEDEKFEIAVRIDGEEKKSDVITIVDAQEQTWALSLPPAAKGAITEGAKATDVTLEADPKKTFDIPYTLTLEAGDSSKYTLGGSTSGRFGTDSATATIAAKSDGDREDDMLTVTAYTAGGAAELASLDIAVKDANALPMVTAMVVDEDGKAQDTMSVAEGDTVKVMLTVVDKDGKAAEAVEDLSISLEPTGAADAQDYRLSTHPIEIAKGKESSAAVDLMITEDQDLGEEDLTFNAVVSGDPKVGPGTKTSMGVLSLMIMDGTQKLVWARTQKEVEDAIYAAKADGAGDDETFTAGEMIEVMGNDVFGAAEGVTLSYAAESDMPGVATASAGGGKVMVTAVGEGMAHITITAHASMPSGAVTIGGQTDPRVASVMFQVEVGLEALTIMLSGPEDMNVVEGGMGAMVTATTNRAASADTVVMLMRDRSMSSAADADFTAEPITIKAGEMMGSTMVMAVEDNMMEDMEELVLYGMTEGMAGEVTGEVKLYLWDAAVPALPIIAQLLLAGLLGLGGYRRYRRR